MKMSRSARNRVSRNHRANPNSPKPSGVIQPRPRQIMLDDPHQNGSIRTVGYLGRNPTKTRYAGSGDAGYRSEWAGKTDIFTDHRWDQTISNKH
jgi:hypothetical protein